jgi:hypothetical protein
MLIIEAQNDLNFSHGLIFLHQKNFHVFFKNKDHKNHHRCKGFAKAWYGHCLVAVDIKFPSVLTLTEKELLADMLPDS